jgi:hypothetical protein
LLKESHGSCILTRGGGHWVDVEPLVADLLPCKMEYNQNHINPCDLFSPKRTFGLGCDPRSGLAVVDSVDFIRDFMSFSCMGQRHCSKFCHFLCLVALCSGEVGVTQVKFSTVLVVFVGLFLFF